jgi:16S rRNA (uracil1498-N3)-methyltransferase
MVERPDRAGVAAFFVPDETLVAGAMISLGESVARHIRVLRHGVGSEIQLTDGAGRRALATIVRQSKEMVAAQVETVEELAAPPAVHLLVPVADRDRMLWLAEKAAELGATSWRPVIWRRSRSVTPRGEGPSFAGKVRARMGAALEQSRGVHLPLLFPEATPERAVAASPEGTRVVLDPEGAPLVALDLAAPVTLAVGPEGGLDAAELGLLEHARFVRASLGDGILRFETAAVAAIAITRSVLHSRRGVANGI